MIRIETEQTAELLTLRVAGKLSGESVAALQDCWKLACQRWATAKQSTQRQRVDLHEVTSIDRTGWRLLRLMHKEGVEVSGNSLAAKTIEDEFSQKEESCS